MQEVYLRLFLNLCQLKLLYIITYYFSHYKYAEPQLLSDLIITTVAITIIPRLLNMKNCYAIVLFTLLAGVPLAHCFPVPSNRDSLEMANEPGKFISS